MKSEAIKNRVMRSRLPHIGSMVGRTVIAAYDEIMEPIYILFDDGTWIAIDYCQDRWSDSVSIEVVDGDVDEIAPRLLPPEEWAVIEREEQSEKEREQKRADERRLEDLRDEIKKLERKLGS